jgi:HAD superfamily hydrolase (TIGR01509 family)
VLNNGEAIVFFDFDGVIADTELLATEAVYRVFKQFCPALNKEYFISHFGGRGHHSIARELSRSDDAAFPSDLTEQVMGAVDDALFQNAKRCEGIEELLTGIGPLKAIVSNSPLYRIQRLLTRLRLDHAFHLDHIISSDRVWNPKPHPSGYLMASQAFGALPHQCVAIEDSATGAVAAASAGCGVIGYTGASQPWNKHAQHLEEAGCFVVINHLREAPRHIRSFIENRLRPDEK